MARISRRELRPLRRYANMIFQDPFYSLDPRWTILDIVGEPLKLAKLASGRELEERVAHLMDVVGLEANAPAALSPCLQRRASASASAWPAPWRPTRASSSPTNPFPPSMSPRRRRSSICSKTCRPSLGWLIFSSPTTSAWSSISPTASPSCTSANSSKSRRKINYSTFPNTRTAKLCSRQCPGPNPILKKSASSCRVKSPTRPIRRQAALSIPRCQYAQDRCRAETPALREVNPGQWSACHFAEELDLVGAPQ